MIQRKQTFFLIISFVLSITLFFLPLAEIEHSIKYIYKLCYLKQVGDTNTLLYIPYGNCILNSFSALLLPVIIFLFKKRNLQMRLCGLAILLNTTLLAAIFFYVDSYAIKLNIEKVIYTYWVLIPIINILLIYIALHLIKKDEKLVRAADRLR
jgi:hypothetical protein